MLFCTSLLSLILISGFFFPLLTLSVWTERKRYGNSALCMYPAWTTPVLPGLHVDVLGYSLPEFKAPDKQQERRQGSTSQWTLLLAGLGTGSWMHVYQTLPDSQGKSRGTRQCAVFNTSGQDRSVAACKGIVSGQDKAGLFHEITVCLFLPDSPVWERCRSGTWCREPRARNWNTCTQPATSGAPAWAPGVQLRREQW